MQWPFAFKEIYTTAFLKQNIQKCMRDSLEVIWFELKKKNMDNLVSHFLSWIDCFKRVELESMVQLD